MTKNGKIMFKNIGQSSRKPSGNEVLKKRPAGALPPGGRLAGLSPLYHFLSETIPLFVEPVKVNVGKRV